MPQQPFGPDLLTRRIRRTQRIPDTDPLYQNLLARGGLLIPPTINQEIQPAALVANQNNYAPIGLETAGVLHLEPSGAARTITGINAKQQGIPGRILFVHNISATQDLVLSNNDGASLAANRFDLGTNITLNPAEGVLLLYNKFAQRWYMVGSPAGTLVLSDNPLSLLAMVALGAR